MRGSCLDSCEAVKQYLLAHLILFSQTSVSSMKVVTYAHTKRLHSIQMIPLKLLRTLPPLGMELIRLRKMLFAPVRRELMYAHTGSFGDEFAAQDGSALRDSTRQSDWDGRVHSQAFLENCVQVLQARDGLERDVVVGVVGAADFGGQVLEVVRVAGEEVVGDAAESGSLVVERSV